VGLGSVGQDRRIVAALCRGCRQRQAAKGSRLDIRYLDQVAVEDAIARAVTLPRLVGRTSRAAIAEQPILDEYSRLPLFRVGVIIRRINVLLPDGTAFMAGTCRGRARILGIDLKRV